MTDEQKSQHPDESQNEASLIYCMVVLLKYKWLIISFVVLAFAGSLLRISIHNSQFGSNAKERSAAPMWYSSESVIEAGEASTATLKAVMVSRKLTAQILEKSTVLKDFPLEFVDEKNLQQAPAKPPTPAELYKIIQERLEIKSENGIVKLSCRGSDKAFPGRILDEYLQGTSEFLRAQDAPAVKDQIAYIQKKIAAARNEQVKARLAGQLVDLFDRERRVSESLYYGFRIIDPPSAAEATLPKRPSSTPKPLSKWSMMPSLIASFIVALTLAFLIEYIAVLRKKNPGQFDTLKKYMKFR
jgi:hypothetical protein